MFIDDDAELVGESELYDLWNEAQSKAVAIAEKLDLTNEDLQRIRARWFVISQKPQNIARGDGGAMSALAGHVLTIRQVQGLASLMRPDETMVPLVELAARHRGRKGEA